MGALEDRFRYGRVAFLTFDLGIVTDKVQDQDVNAIEYEPQDQDQTQPYIALTIIQYLGHGQGYDQP